MPAVNISRLPMEIRKIEAAVIAALIFAVIETIAVFNNGGYFLGAMSLCVISSWLLLIFLVFTYSREGRIEFTWHAFLVVVMFFLFWAWTCASVSWSIASDLSWVEANRTGGYVAILLCGVILGKSRTARKTAAFLFLAIATASAIYSIGVKALPLAFENYEDLVRVFGPLGYPNASGLMSSLAIPLAIFFSAERTNLFIIRLSSCIAAVLLLMAMIFTQSRGAFIALGAGMIIYMFLSPIRIRSLIMLCIAMLPALVFLNQNSGQEGFIKYRAELQTRLLFAETLRWYITLSVILVAFVTMLVIYIDKKKSFSADTVRVTGIIISILVITSASVAIAGFIKSKEPSFTEWAKDTYIEFKMSTSGGAGKLGRLSSSSSGKRWHIWEEALRSWQDRPLSGHGAQSFPITHLLEREQDVGLLKQAHGVMFGILSELGAVGFLIFSLFLVASIAVATLLIKTMGGKECKGLAVSIFSLTLIYLVRTSFDWDWNMYALTAPFFLFTGILAGWFKD